MAIRIKNYWSQSYLLPVYLGNLLSTLLLSLSTTIPSSRVSSCKGILLEFK
jgi:hypothetical protein